MTIVIVLMAVVCFCAGVLLLFGCVKFEKVSLRVLTSLWASGLLMCLSLTLLMAAMSQILK